VSVRNSDVVDYSINRRVRPGGGAQDWSLIVRGEYLEVPGLSLTRAQVQRLWGLDAAQCDKVLDGLIASGFLLRTRSGTFIRS